MSGDLTEASVEGVAHEYAAAVQQQLRAARMAVAAMFLEERFQIVPAAYMVFHQDGEEHHALFITAVSSDADGLCSIAALEYPDHANMVLVWRLCPQRGDVDDLSRMGPNALRCRFTAIPHASVLQHRA